MCWNEKISFGTFYFAISTILLMYYLSGTPPLLAVFPRRFCVGAGGGRSVLEKMARRQKYIPSHHRRPCSRIDPAYLAFSAPTSNDRLCFGRHIAAGRAGTNMGSESCGGLEWSSPMAYYGIPYSFSILDRPVFLSFYLICFYLFVRHGTFGSMWCWISNIIFILYAIEMLFLRPMSC